MFDKPFFSRYMRTFAVASLFAAWSGCDHGPLPPTTPSPAPLATSSPSAPVASPTPTLAPAGVQVSGSVFDRDTNRPLAHSIVVISHEMFPTEVSPTVVHGGAVAMSNSDGTFTLRGIAAGIYPVEVYAPGHIALHAELTIGNTDMQLTQFRVSHLTPEEQNWLNQLNRDRATWGAPPLIADEAVVEAARMRAATLANNGVFSHTCMPLQKNCLTGPDAELANGAYQTGGENIGAQNEGSWRDIESGMLAEWTHCNPAARKPHTDGCSFSEETGHFLNMVNRSYHFVGVASYHHGRSFDLSYGPSTDYYAMEFE